MDGEMPFESNQPVTLKKNWACRRCANDRSIGCILMAERLTRGELVALSTSTTSSTISIDVRRAFGQRTLRFVSCRSHSDTSEDPRVCGTVDCCLSLASLFDVLVWHPNALVGCASLATVSSLPTVCLLALLEMDGAVVDVVVSGEVVSLLPRTGTPAGNRGQTPTAHSLHQPCFSKSSTHKGQPTAALIILTSKLVFHCESFPSPSCTLSTHKTPNGT
jgi:hypothetical protein